MLRDGTVLVWAGSPPRSAPSPSGPRPSAARGWCGRAEDPGEERAAAGRGPLPAPQRRPRRRRRPRRFSADARSRAHGGRSRRAAVSRAALERIAGEPPLLARRRPQPTGRAALAEALPEAGRRPAGGRLPRGPRRQGRRGDARLRWRRRSTHAVCTELPPPGSRARAARAPASAIAAELAAAFAAAGVPPRRRAATTGARRSRDRRRDRRHRAGRGSHYRRGALRRDALELVRRSAWTARRAQSCSR